MAILKRLKTFRNGSDCGNNSLKIATEQGTTTNYQNIFIKVGQSDKNIIENEYKLKYGVPQKVSGKKMRSYLHTRINKYKDGKLASNDEYLFGQLCTKFKNEDTLKLENRGKNFKHSDLDLINNAIICNVNSQLELLDKSELKEEITMDLSIGVGLPISEYNGATGDIDPREIFKDNFLGNYVLEFLHPYYPVKKVNLTISNVCVSREGLSPLNDSASSKLFDEEGNSLMKNFTNKYFLVMDCGCYTYDIAALKVVYNYDEDDYEVEIVSSFTNSSKEGIGTAIDKVLATVNSDNSIKVGNNVTFDRQDVISAMRQGVKLEGDIDIEESYNNAIKDIATSTSKFFYNSMEKSSIPPTAVEEILICGGAAEIDLYVKTVKENLSKKYPDMKKDVFKVAENPVMQNALSYLADIIDFTDDLEEEENN